MEGMDNDNRNEASPVRIYAQIREDLDKYFYISRFEEANQTKPSLQEEGFRLRWLILHLECYGDLLERFFEEFAAYFEGTYPNITGLRDGLFGPRMPDYDLMNEFFVSELEKRKPKAPSTGSE